MIIIIMNVMITEYYYYYYCYYHGVRTTTNVYFRRQQKPPIGARANQSGGDSGTPAKCTHGDWPSQEQRGKATEDRGG